MSLLCVFFCIFTCFKNQIYMLRIIVIFIVITVFFSCNNFDNRKNISKVKALVDNFRKQVSPDARDLIFDTNVIYEQEKFVLKGVTDLPVIKEKLFKFLKTKGYDVVDSLNVLPEQKFKKYLGITRLSVVNLRAKPRHTSELVTQSLMGMPLLIFEEKNGFYHVKTPENYYAWVAAAGVILMDSVRLADWLKLPKIIITKHCGKVYDSSNQNACTLSDFVLNDVFGFVQIQDNYAQVAYPDGRTGYIKNDSYLTLRDYKEKYLHATNEDITDAAVHYSGIPYLWGGTSTKALDCSGFVKNVYAQFGYNLPRDASQQVKIGKKILITDDFSDLQAGDLLFFGVNKNAVEKITHVALHLSNGRMIHATGEVKIESLNKNDADFNSDRYKTFLQARRIIGYVERDFVSYYTPQCPMLKFVK